VSGVVREIEHGYIWENAPQLIGAGAATFSLDRRYRYWLARAWDTGIPRPRLTWIMLNPSKAGADVNDMTVGRCVDFTRIWGYSALTIANLYALIATDPRELRKHPDPVGPGNDEFITKAAQQSARVVVAWGAHPMAGARAAEVLRLPGMDNVWCLGRTKDGYPRHPCRLSGDTELVPYQPRATA
jgi:hypothetical protein